MMARGAVLLHRSSPLLLFYPSVLDCGARSPFPAVQIRAAAVEPTPSAREKRQLRKERRASSSNWREEVEDRLLQKPKKQYVSWTEKLNLDLLARLGPQWWVLRVPRLTAQDSAERLARSLARKFPHIDFKVYHPAVKEKRKLKNGSFSVKMKPLFPGCVFLYCVLNKEIHDFIRECDGIGGFLGSKVGNTKRQINKPKPVAVEDVEVIFRQAREEQDKADQAFLEEHQEKNSDASVDSTDGTKPISDVKHAKDKRKRSAPSRKNTSSEHNPISLAPGTSVRVLSGPFTEFSGRLKKLDIKTGKATVEFVLFGKESLMDVEVDQIVADASTT